MTLTDLCEKLRNWFDVDRHFGTFTIENGTIDLDFIREGQFYRLIGGNYSGIYQLVQGKLRFVVGTEIEKYLSVADGSFDGAVWELAFPVNFLLVYEKMCNFETKNTDVLSSPYQSESFGGYSYSKASGSNGVLSVWDNFASDLSRWQKI